MSDALAKPLIVQYWEGDIDTEVASSIQKWKDLNPEFDHKLFGKDEATKYIAQNFSDIELQAFNDCALPAMRSDYFRLCALTAEPNVLYVDANITPKISIKEAGFYKHKWVMLVEIHLPNWRIWNGLAANWEHGRGRLLFRKVLNAATRRINKRLVNDVWTVTGPGVWTKILSEFIKSKEIPRIEVIAQSLLVGRFFRGKKSIEHRVNHWSLVQQNQSIFNDYDHAAKEQLVIFPEISFETEIHVFGMKRSGHHLVVDIVQDAFKDSLYINNVPIQFANGTPEKNALLAELKQFNTKKTLIVSLEDVRKISDFKLTQAKHYINIVVMRDPLNNYASRLKFLENTSKNQRLSALNKNWVTHSNLQHFYSIFDTYYKEFSGESNALSNKIPINYNTLISNDNTTELKKIYGDKPASYDIQKIISPHGSSFSGQQFTSLEEFHSRYKNYLDHPSMKSLCNDERIISICRDKFGISATA